MLRTEIIAVDITRLDTAFIAEKEAPMMLIH